MARRVHFAAERLSPEGLALVHRGLRENWTYRRIMAALKEATGERLAPASLGRYARHHGRTMRELRRAQEEAAVVIAEMKAGSVSAADVATALVGRALFEARRALKKAPPMALSREVGARERLDLKRAEIELRREQLELARRRQEAMERRLETLREKAKKLNRAVEERPRGLSPEVIAEIRELYGLTEEK